MRIYTKVPGKPADRARPFTLPIGSTVLDLAREIHRDFEHSLKSARIWGTGVFDGQAAKHDHELHDGDRGRAARLVSRRLFSRSSVLGIRLRAGVQQVPT